MADEMKRTELSEEEVAEQTDSRDAQETVSTKKTKSKGRTAAIVVAWIVGVLVILFFLFGALVTFIQSEFFGRLVGKLFLDNLFGKMNYVSETDYQVPSDWDVDEDGIGASTDLEDLINQMQKEQEEKEKAEKEQAEKEQGQVSPDLAE